MERYNQIKKLLRENSYEYRDDYRSLVSDLSPEEQDKINDTILSIDRLIQLHAEKLELYKQHRKGLIQKLIGFDKFVPGDKLHKPELRFTLDTLNKLDEGLNLSKRAKTDMGHLFYPVLSLLNYSFGEIGWEYRRLTPNEKSLISESDFNELRDLYQQSI